MAPPLQLLIWCTITPHFLLCGVQQK